MLVCCCWLALQVQAQQVNMTIQVPPTGVMLKNQLWNLLLVNSGNAPVTVFVGLSLLSTADNQPVMTAVTKPILLPKGAKQLTASDVAPVNYTYLSSAFNADMNPNGLLPVGNYVACFTVYMQVYELRTTLAEDCVPVEVQPLNPPQLNTPADESVLDMQYPQFTWLPPMPLQLFNNLQYDFILVAQQPGQSAVQAIQQNIPVFNTHTSSASFLNYPSSNAALDTGVHYAWCVVAKNNNQFVAQSEVWTFKIQRNVVVSHSRNGTGYIRLKNGLDASIAACNGNLMVIYNNEAGDSTVQYSIKAIDDGKNMEIVNGTAPVDMGENFLNIAIGKNKLVNKRMYLFQVRNKRQELWGTKFLYNKETE